MKHKDWHSSALALKKKGFSNREISRRLFGRDSKESTLRKFFKEVELHGLIVPTLANKPEEIDFPYVDEEDDKTEIKMLFWDIETSIKRSWHFQQDKYLTSSQLDKDTFILTSQWQWGIEGDDVEIVKIRPEDAVEENDFDVVLATWQLLDKADVVVGHNVKRFDIKIMNARFAYYGLPEPSPYKVIDTYLMARQKFGFTFKSLAHLCKYLGLPVQKLSHEGISLWIKATQGDAQAIEDMATYGLGDIPTLIAVYKRLLGWGIGATNIGTIRKGKQPELAQTLLCPSCGSDDITPLNNKAYTPTRGYEAYRCSGCMGVSRKSGNNLVRIAT